MKHTTAMIVTRFATGIVGGAVFWSAFAHLPAAHFSAFLLLILAAIICLEWRRLFPVTSAPFWLLLPFYPILPFALMITLNQDPAYRSILAMLFMIVFAFDTGSYLIGSLVGRLTIAPHISPHKTWEGFVGGYCAAVVGCWFILREFDAPRSLDLIVPITFLTCLLALAGDLFESWLKRRAHIKDAGFLLPGHGGFLDRFDGIMFAVFFFYLLRVSLAEAFFP